MYEFIIAATLRLYSILRGGEAKYGLSIHQTCSERVYIRDDFVIRELQQRTDSTRFFFSGKQEMLFMPHSRQASHELPDGSAIVRVVTKKL